MQRGSWFIPLLGLLPSHNEKERRNKDESKEPTIVIKKLILDALKPREIGIIELSKTLCNVTGVSNVNITVTEVDARTETVKIIITGNNLDYDKIAKVIEECGVVIRSIDEVSVQKE